MTPIAYALAVYHEARRRVWLRSLGTSCPSEGNPYDGRCWACAESMEWIVANVIRDARAAEEAARIRRRDEAVGNVFALDQTATADRRDLLTALDEARRERDAALAREARLREAASQRDNGLDRCVYCRRTVIMGGQVDHDPQCALAVPSIETRCTCPRSVPGGGHNAYCALWRVADPTATTWLADRERAAAVRALRWAAERMQPGPGDSAEWAQAIDVARGRLECRADAIEAGKEPTP